jgi:aminoglycoside 6'-N-acetyltransferase I
LPSGRAWRNVARTRIELCESAVDPGWLRLRQALWPDCPREQHLADMRASVADRRRYANFLAFSAQSEAIGLAEVSLRSDYVNGTESSPVAFLEGLYVVPEARRKGVAAALVSAACEWGRGAGCSEIASDAALENVPSHVVHRALGFEETERVVYFRRKLA